MENILAGIQLATTPEALIAILIGLIAGQILGAIPGLTASMAVALLVPSHSIWIHGLGYLCFLVCLKDHYLEVLLLRF